MTDQKPQYLNRLGKSKFKVITLILIGYSLFTIYLYYYYNNRAELEKSQILHQYYDKLATTSHNKINYLLSKFLNDFQQKNISIAVLNHNIEMCNDKKCERYNLIKFGSLLNGIIPKYIHYKIELNENLLYSDAKTQNYDLEKKYYIDNYIQFNISLVIDNLYWIERESYIKKPLWHLTLFILSNLALLYILYKISARSFNNAYKSYYLQKYEYETKQLKVDNENALKSCESSLMKKIWNIDFSKQKDLEINCLLAQEANKIAFIDTQEDEQVSSIKKHRFKNFSNKIPCSIILYKNDTKEEVNIAKFREIFTNRFSTEDEKLLILVPSEVKIVHFASEAALYQIIYSITSYLFFILKKQYPANNNQINLSVNIISKKLQLCFEYQGTSIEDEKELFKISNSFFKTHANPFLLNINQTCKLLKLNGYDFNISCDKSNIIEIMERNKDLIHSEVQEDNVILLSSVMKKKNEKL